MQDPVRAMGFQKEEQMKKRLLSILLCVCLTAGFITLPAAATADAAAQGGDIAFGNTLAAGYHEVSVIKTDGTLWTWGGSRWDTESGGYVPVTVPEQVQGIPLAASVEMANGVFASDFSMVITTDGELWNWGIDFLGRLGREADGSRTPGKVMERVRDVDAGYAHTAALTEDGVLWAWGENDSGQLGNGGTGTVFECYDGVSLVYETLPVKVMTDVVSVSAGENCTAAIRSDGSLWTWGSNNHGQLGNGGGGNAEGRADENGVKPPIQTVPARVMENVAMVSAGDYKTYVVKTDGSLWSFGGVVPTGSTVWDEERGMFITTKSADDVTVYRVTPEKIMDDVVYVSSSGNTAAAIKSDGSLWTWGQNLFGMLGRGSDEINLAGRNTPEKIMDGVATVAVGGNFMAAITYDGGVWTWGWNDSGSLGDGTTEDSSVPIRVMEGAALPGWVTKPESDALAVGTSADGKGGGYAPVVVQPVPTPAPLPEPVPEVVSTLILDANGGNVGVQRVKLTYGTKIGALPTAWREGYTFDGWYTERDGGIPVTEFMNDTLIGEQTVYAHWAAYRETPSVSDLSFSFVNSQRDFGYPDGYSFPIDPYRYYFGDSAFATECFNKRSVWSGSCWGMSMTTSIIRSVNDVPLASFRSDAKTPADLTLNDWSEAAHTNLGGMIQLNQVSYNSVAIQKTQRRNRNQLEAMAQAALAYYYTGNHPVIVSFWGPRDENGSRAGHAVVGYAVYRNPSEDFDRLMVYDPNFPGDASRYITLYRDAENHYTGWYYHINDQEDWGSAYDGGNITYSTYDVYYPVWFYRGWTDYHAGTITINTPNAAILDYSGEPVAQVRDGELFSDRPDVFPLLQVDSAADGGGDEGVTVFLPNDYYQIVNEDETVTELRVTMTNGTRSAKVTTDAEKVLCYVDEAGATDAVLVDGGGSAYEIELRAGDEVVALSGTTPDYEPSFLARQDGALYALGVDPQASALTLDGVESSTAALNPASIVAVVSASQPAVVSAVFSDVSAGASYASAVQWALDGRITNGTATGCFTPEGVCTRAQALTLLWRAMGEPEPADGANPFADVEEGAYYDKAVRWAVSEGVTGGTDAARFSPDAPCSNAEMLTFLWRAMGEPLKTGEGDWCDDALRWARTSGVAAEAEADAACPRCEGVAFLFRALG